MKKELRVCAILENVRSSHNVGSIFRTADALGVQKIFLAGYTPAPKDKFGRINKEIAKTALGAEESVAWESVESVSKCIKGLKREEFAVVAVELHSKSSDYRKFKLKGSTVFIFGNEVDGVSEKTIKLCDEIVAVPMKGKKESLNVSVTFGIVMSRICDF
jgi:tRNA G18 (ribose-2'-O)-methylase SpoU